MADMPEGFIPDDWGLGQAWKLPGSEPNCYVPPCETCNGHGKVENDFGSYVRCPDCAGLGYIPLADDE